MLRFIAMIAALVGTSYSYANQDYLTGLLQHQSQVESKDDKTTANADFDYIQALIIEVSTHANKSVISQPMPHQKSCEGNACAAISARQITREIMTITLDPRLHPFRNGDDGTGREHDFSDCFVSISKYRVNTKRPMRNSCVFF
ncbi:MAG: hypothetical protein R2827_15310 [Bdellovibrionales bacterium]